MPCFIGCMALAFPRLALALVWFFGSGYLYRVYEHWYWIALGFLFLPLTTLGFAYASHSLAGPGELTPFGWLLTAVAFAADLGLVRGRKKG